MGTAIETKNRGVDDLPILSRKKAGFKPSPFSLIVEAEDYNKKVSHKGTWEIVEDTKLSSAKGVKAPMPIEPSDHQTFSPRLEYNFVAPTSGVYYIWFRTKASDPGTNSINYTVGGRSKQILSFPYPEIAWTRGVIGQSLPAGAHKLIVWKLERGAILDRIVITDNPNLTIRSM